jgi:hypothetical protein
MQNKSWLVDGPIDGKFIAKEDRIPFLTLVKYNRQDLYEELDVCLDL